MCLFIGNHTFASVKGPEEYDFLKACFEPVWKDIIADPYVTIGGQQHKQNNECCVYVDHNNFYIMQLYIVFGHHDWVKQSQCHIGLYLVHSEQG